MTAGTRRPARDAVRTGTGYAPCHHGEILQGVFRDDHGGHCPGLVTLPMNEPGTHARFVPRHGTLTVTPADRTKALRAAALTIEECAALRRQDVCGGELRLTGNIPVGLGMGSSTSDVLAAVRAVADAFALRLAPGTVTRIALRAELACDPLMLDDRPRLFAQRHGRVLEVLGEALPPVVVVGCALAGGAPVDTLALPAPSCTDDDIDTYESLRTHMRRAVRDRDPRLLGHVATASARLGQLRLRQAGFDTLTALADRAGAVGVQIAHSGSVAGVLFDPAAPGARRRIRRCAQDLEREGLPVTRTFTTFPTPEESPHGPAHRRGDRPPRPDTSRRPARLPAL
ncbi:GHMP kinase [Streptomyces sp. NPDC050400]|uniref:GHMP family kinase ATP-binding protein n=1 Tax=Streptomyces sp. NPDC050400 TaxID=3365610 RepID=UPI0037A6D716